MQSPEEAKTIYALHKFELVDSHSLDNSNSDNNEARPSMLSVPSMPSSQFSHVRKQVKVTITS